MICPICRKEIKDGSKFCGKCGRQIPRCPGCGEVIYKRTRFCVYDGTPLSETLLELLPESEPTISVSNKSSKKKRKVGKIILTVVLILLLMIVLIAAGLFGYVAVKGVPPFIEEYFGLDKEDVQEKVEYPEEIEEDILQEEETFLVEEEPMETIEEPEEEEPEVIETIHSYEVIAGDFSWEGARMACENKGGYLATITSKEEYDTICEIADNSGLTYLWLGALRYSDSDKWEDGSWITGEEWTFDYWYPGEPSMEDLDGTKEYYLCMWNAKYEGTDIGWTFNDQRNDIVWALPSVSGSVGCICEYEEEVNNI